MSGCVANMPALSRPLRRVLAASMALLLMAGCGGGLRSADSVPVTYVLRGLAPSDSGSNDVRNSEFGNVRPVLRTSLQVLRAEARPGYSNDRIVLLGPGQTLDVYAASRWPGEMPVMLAALTLDALRARGAVAVVHDASAPFAADYTLRLVVRRFDADYSKRGMNSAPDVTIGFDITLGRRADRSVLAAFAIDRSVTAGDNRMQAVVAAFDSATQQAFEDLARKVGEAVAADQKPPS